MIDLADIFGFLGNTLAILFFLSPITIIVNLIKTKDNSKIPYLLFISVIINCQLYVIYGLKISVFFVWFCNMIGFVLNLFYLIMYIEFCDYSRCKKIMLNFSCLFYLLISTYLMFTFKNNQDHIALAAMIINIISFVTPLQKISEVMKTKDNTYIPIGVSICLLLNCIFWCLFGMCKNFNYYIIIPNFIGIILACAQIIIYIIYESMKIKTHDRLEKQDNNTSDEENLKEEGKKVMVDDISKERQTDLEIVKVE